MKFALSPPYQFAALEPSILDPGSYVYWEYAWINWKIRTADGMQGPLGLHESYKKYDLEYKTVSKGKKGKKKQKVKVKMPAEASWFVKWKKLYYQVLNGAPDPVIVEDFTECLDLMYDHETCNSVQQLFVGEDEREFQWDPRTTDAVKAEWRPQLDECILEGIGHRVITPDDGDVISVRFPDVNGEKRGVTIFYCKPHSECPYLQRVWESAYGKKNVGELDRCVDEMKRGSSRRSITRDYLGGGEYFAHGFGIRTNAPKGVPNKEVYQPGTPFSMLTSNLPGFDSYHRQLGVIMGSVAGAIMRHEPELYQRNENIRSMNQLVCFPALHKQDIGNFLAWTAAQVALRQVGATKIPKGMVREDNIGSLHFDSGDFAESQPLIYIPSCYGDHKGGTVSDSDLVVFQKQTGGKSVRIKTNIRNTVCIVLFNAHDQLHGMVKGNGPDDGQSWVNRIIPYIQHKTACWMKNNPNRKPYDSYLNILPRHYP